MVLYHFSIIMFTPAIGSWFVFSRMIPLTLNTSFEYRLDENKRKMNEYMQRTVIKGINETRSCLNIFKQLPVGYVKVN